jgi:hypothetical protein
LAFQEKAVFQQSSAIRLLIYSGLCTTNQVVAWKNRKKTDFNNTLLLGS